MIEAPRSQQTRMIQFAQELPALYGYSLEKDNGDPAYRPQIEAKMLGAMRHRYSYTATVVLEEAVKRAILIEQSKQNIKETANG